MADYLSGRKKLRPFASLSTDRYRYLGLDQAEPNLGFPGEKSVAIAQTYYNLVTFDGATAYDRYWLQYPPAELIDGISIFDEGSLVGTANSVSKIDFVGNIVEATAVGSISTVRITAPGNSGEVLYNDSDNFNSTNLIVIDNINSRIGVGTSSPDYFFDINGDTRLRSKLVDSNNQVGLGGSVLISTGIGISWTFPNFGPQGLQGIQGSLGIQGSQGVQGPQGTQGVQGIQGILGIQGTQGVQGPQGTQGIQGRQGTQGIQGIQGTQGILGVQGIQGIQGILGIQGTQGTTGSQGLQGVQGSLGIQGSQGIQGIQGLTGTQGIQGLTGQGTQGTQGTSGVQGLQGTTGSATQGVQGTQGTLGLQGIQGIAGNAVQGVQGTQGIQGIQGITGVQGVTGSTWALNDTWVKTPDGKNRFYFTTNGRTYFGSQSGYEWRSAADVNIAEMSNGGSFISYGDLRAPIFYDQNDTGYYTDPAGRRSTQINGFTDRTKMTLGLTAKYGLDRADYTSDTNYWTGIMGWGTTDFNNVMTWGSGFFDTWSSPANSPGDTTHWVGVQAYHYVNAANSGYGWQLAGGVTDSLWWRHSWPNNGSWFKVAMYANNANTSSFYATIYYDSNDTNFYCDPNSTSVFNQLIVTNNGAGTNIRIGDDCWIGDVNLANTFRISGVQNSDRGYITFGNNDVQLGRITTGALTWGGDFTASGNVTAYSDIRYKENVKNIENALDKIKKINGITYTRNDLDDKDKKYTGVIAQEVEQVLPEVIEENENGIKSVAYGNMVGLLIEAIKDQQKIIEKQSSEIDNLKNFLM